VPFTGPGDGFREAVGTPESVVDRRLTVKKGRHRRYEEARALKQNQDLDLDAIFDSLDVVESTGEQDEESSAFDAWSDEYDEDEGSEGLEESAETA